MAGRAVAVAAEGPAGPVQVNVPFREPLLPDGPLETPAAERRGRARSSRRSPGAACWTTTRSRRWRAGWPGRERGLIVAGPDDDPALPAALAALARATGFPILADPLSGLRTGPHDQQLVLARGDQLARPGPWLDAHLPDLVIRTGAMPTSKPVVELLARARPELLVLDGDARLARGGAAPGHVRPRGRRPPPRPPLAARLAAVNRDPAAEPGWTADWVTADRVADAAMVRWISALDEPFEGAPWPVLADLLPDGAVLWAGSSMPVRDLDAWLPSTDRAITVRSNRGANGIDGVVSTALGSAAVADGPVALVLGDIAFLHDLNALVAARLHGLSATIVLVNNDGGGIFSFLPQAQPAAARPGTGLPEHYEELFGTPHGIDVGPIVTALGGEHRVVGNGGPGGGDRGLHRPARRPGPGAADGPGPERRSSTATWPRSSRAALARAACRVSGIVVDGLRWEVRARGTGPPLLLLHGFTGRGHRLGRPRARLRPRLPRHHGGPARPRAHAARHPGPHERGADRGRPRDDPGASWMPRPRTSSATRSAPGSRSGSRSRTPDVVARLVLESPSAGLADAGGARGPPRRRRGAGDGHRARRHRRLRDRMGAPARLREPCLAPARPGRPPPRDAPANSPSGLAA